MAIMPLIGMIALAVIALYIGSTYLGVSGFLLSAIFVASVLAALKWAGIPFASAFPLNKKYSGWLAAIGLIFVFFTTGALAVWAGQLGLPLAASLEPATTTTAAATTPTAGCFVSDEVKGTSATVTVNAYDQESNTPLSSAIDTTAYVFKNGEYKEKITDTSANGLTGFIAGDVISIYGGDSSYYLDPVTDFCVDGQQVPLNLDAHAVQAESSMQVTCYDDTGTTALDAGSPSYQEDYNLTFGASEEKTFYCKFKNNAADKAFDLAGVATRVTNDMDWVKVLSDDSGGSYTKGFVPSWMSSTVIRMNETGDAVNLTGGYDDAWMRNTVLRLHEWDSVKVKFSAKSTSTNPAADDTPSVTASDLIIVLAFDKAWDQATDGTMFYDTYAHTEDETDVGFAETENSPIGKEIGAIIEAQ